MKNDLFDENIKPAFDKYHDSIQFKQSEVMLYSITTRAFIAGWKAALKLRPKAKPKT